ncbi:MAG: glutamate formimidoyltransferase [Armatimonadetes bacterium]|nr:glutamate formimidoyltransferase [Armatimonadota bacterium]
MSAIIQCVPNFSEGRNESVIQAIVDAVRTVKSVTLADYSSDPDHNRLVVTFLGGPEGIREAVLAATARAVELIDMQKHTGGHPRIGAADVIPLVPIRGITMAECVSISHELGQEIAETLGVPVYFYEKSAIKAHRTNLADVRRGGYERLAEVGLEGERAPDVGPKRLHPSAGAVVVGARGPLVAYNVNLQSDDMEIAADIARKVRNDNAHLPGVKAISVWLESRSKAQVSMNVTRPDFVALPRIFNFIVGEVRKYDVEVDESELIGLVSQKYLDGASPTDLRLRDFKPTQILEYWLRRI